MHPSNQPIYITRSGGRFGPYTLEQCSEMIQSGQLIPGDLAWQLGMAEWRPIGEIIPTTFLRPPMSHPPQQFTQQTPSMGVAPEPEESAGQILGQMGCGCLLWIGLLGIAIGGGVIFPVLLVLLPVALIGGIVDLVRKLIRLSRQRRK